jgi:uroporphyrin-III C-methyltransferase/precorrin-2 dehydrogenase/sirohydrochlorin ferrochelatase
MLPRIDDRRRALGAALAPGGALDPLSATGDMVGEWMTAGGTATGDRLVTIRLRSTDPDDLTIGEARLIGLADHIYHRIEVPPVILDRARADAGRTLCDHLPVEPGPGLVIYMELA